jgi:hypothetical protein
VLGDADARALIDAVPERDPDKLGDLVPAIALPEITNPRLRAGVAGYVALAAQLQAIRDRLCKDRAPGTAAVKPVVEGPDDAALTAALSAWAGSEWGNASAMAQIAQAVATFASDHRGDRFAGGSSAQFQWLPFAVRPGVLAYLALAAGTPRDKRDTIVQLLRALSALPAANLRVCTVHGEPAYPREPTQRFDVRWHGGNAYAIAQRGWSGNTWTVLEYAPDGVWKSLPGVAIVGNPVIGIGAYPHVDAVAAAIDHAAWNEDAPGKLSAATGLTHSEACCVLAGCPQNIDKELRERLDLKATQASNARDAVRAILNDKKMTVLDAAARAGVPAMLADGAVDAVIASWLAVIGTKVPVSEDLIAEADRELQAPMPPSEALAMIANADEAVELGTDGAWALDGSGEAIRVSGPGGPKVVHQSKVEDVVFDMRALNTYCAYAPFLFAELPVGDPLRGKLAVAHERVLARLRNPDMLVAAGYFSAGPDERAGVQALVDAIGGTDIPGLVENRKAREVAGGIVTSYTFNTANDWLRVNLVLRPATLDGKALASLRPLVERTSSWHRPLDPIEYVRGPELGAMIARIGDTPVPAGGWEQNPLASAGKLVTDAAKKLGVSKEAAALYLQYLALLWPTPKNLVTWNGWEAKQLEAAAAELVDKELILEAKRERAQRGHFLPGGWEALKSPHPPMETWKLPLYGRRTPEGHVVPAMTSRFLAFAPFHVLFARAWKRITDGDVPKYEEVKR